MMKALAITNKGLEEFCAKEVEHLLGVSPEICSQCIVFKPKDRISLLRFCYISQSSAKVLLLLDSFRFKSISDILKSINYTKIKPFVKAKTFKVSIKRIGDHEFSSMELADEIGKKIDGTVDLNNPQTIVYVYVIDREAYIGIDLIGFDASKRAYKIFNHPTSLKGTLAFSLLTFAGYASDDIIIDPFCGTGTITIEAGLMAKKLPVHYYSKDKLLFKNHFSFKFEEVDKDITDMPSKERSGFDNQLRHVRSAQKNAKIAGINKSVTFSKLSVEWLDTKFDKSSIDKIITHPPQFSKVKNSKEIEKAYNELFYQAEFVLKNNGNVSIVSKRSESLTKYAEKHRFTLIDKKEVYSGKEKMFFLKYQKL